MEISAYTRRMLNEKPNVIVIIVVVITTNVTTIMILNYQMTSASLDDDDDDESMSTNGIGYGIGMVHGREDNRGGNEHNDRCLPGDNDILWCIGYEIGYNDGYYGSSRAYRNK